MKIYTAMIDHEYGMNYYAATSEDGLCDRIFEFVSTWWDHEDLHGRHVPLDTFLEVFSKRDAINVYFENAYEEYLYRSDPLEIPDPTYDVTVVIRGGNVVDIGDPGNIRVTIIDEDNLAAESGE